MNSSHSMNTKQLKASNLSTNINSTLRSNCNVQINPKLFNPPLQVGDILEISSALQTNLNVSLNSVVHSVSSCGNTQPTTPGQSFTLSNSNDDDCTLPNPILLQLTQQSICENMMADSIRLDAAAFAEPFNIKPYSNVNVSLVDKKLVTLDVVELLFKEQYLNGSDMWRYKMQLEGKCVHLKKSIEFCGMRCVVREMWANGEIVTCGYISDVTRLVFRSQSAMCTIYIQMSKEMWEFDVNGEMYHEKAINFLVELFTNWKNQTCQHDVTIALFSRVYYEAKYIEDFPSSITTCIRQDYRGRFYEDFYRIVHQNERYEDWMLTLVQLKRLIKEYCDYILNYHNRQCASQNVPKCYLSSAAEGNFLETLNLSSSVFERHFIDRPFDRTGMMSLIVTAGCGVFEVCRELTKITKERVIDNGIGSDLVCLGEQPLHSVPLFKFSGTETYSIPHWINLSFYKSSEIVRYCNSNFRPCVKIKFNKRTFKHSIVLPDYNMKHNQMPLEESDDIFFKQKSSELFRKAPSRINTSHDMLSIPATNVTRQATKRTTGNDSDDERDENSSLEFDSDPETTVYYVNGANTNGSKKTINPFKPSTIKAKMSFERRRWAHLFPLRPDGTPIFSHQVTVSSGESKTKPLAEQQHHQPILTSPLRDTTMSKEKKRQTKSSSLQNTTTNRNVEVDLYNEERMNGGDECIAKMITGVAWKSLTIPACLPLTTDFSPNKTVWRERFVCASNYSLLLDEIREQYNYINYNNIVRISMKDVFPELVGHRLAMGFQMVISKNISSNSLAEALSRSTSVTARNYKNSIRRYYKLSLGRIYHELFYIVDSQTEFIKVEIYTPPDKSAKDKTQKIKYAYRFQVPDSRLYQVSFCDISRKNVGEIKWNLIDCYICIQGNGSLSPRELQNCWRQRLYLIPLVYLQPTTPTNSVSNTPTTPTISPIQTNLASFYISQNLPGPFNFDIYQRKTADELKCYRESHFIRFMEYLNKLSRADDRRITVSSPVQLSPSFGLKERLADPRVCCEPLIDDYRQYLGNDQKDEADMLKKKIVFILENEYKIHMLNQVYGLPFLVSKNDIPLNCFISAEATWWCMHNINSIDTEAQAIAFLQILIDFDIIQHISKQENNYIHGFYLYYILTNESRSHFLYTKDYCEIGLCEFECGIFNEKNIFFLKHLPAKTLPVLPSDYTYSKSILNTALESPILKLVNVDVDPNRRSDRVEWASAIYRSYYHPLCALELEIYWKMATGQLLSDLINSWTKMAIKFNYHIVPSPIDPFAMPIATPACSDPLRGPLYIQLNMNCILQDEFILFENCIEKKYLKFNENNSRDDILGNVEFQQFLWQKYVENSSAGVAGGEQRKDKQQVEQERRSAELNEKIKLASFVEMELQEFFERERIIRLQYFQEAILEKFGFIRNAAIAEHNDDDPTFFIHSSGGMFVLIPNYYANYTARSRHASAQAASSNFQAITSPGLVIHQQETEFKTLNEENLKNLLENLASSDLNGKNADGSSNVGFLSNELKTQSLAIKSSITNKNEIFSSYSPTTGKMRFEESTPRIDLQRPHNVNFDDSSASNSMTTFSKSSNVKQRERSNTKYLAQFWELNKVNINNMMPSDEKAITKSQSDTGYQSLCENSTNEPANIYTTDNKTHFDAQDHKQNQLVSTNATKPITSKIVNKTCAAQTFMIEHNVVKRKLPFYADSDLFIGFLWSWNFMLGKRWRNQYTGDELFQDSALADFRAFCSNKDMRLQNFFNNLK